MPPKDQIDPSTALVEKEKQSQQVSHLSFDDETPSFSLSDNKNDNKNENDNTLSFILSTATLCWCTLTHSWLLISVFPYSGFMAMHLVDGLTEENAGSSAGLIASIFMLGRFFSSYGWGKIADWYGRKFVLISSLALSMVFSILFGLSSTFHLALFWRFMLGLSNGIVGTAKTITSEISYGNEKLESKAMGLVLGMWGWGFLISPALSGILADPIRQYPNVVDILPSSMMVELLTNFPFLIPNIVSAIFCFLAILAVHYVVPETLSEEGEDLSCSRRRRRNPLSMILWDSLNFVKEKTAKMLACCCCTIQNKTNNNDSEISRLLDDKGETKTIQYNSTHMMEQEGNSKEQGNNPMQQQEQKMEALESQSTISPTSALILQNPPKEATVMSLWLQKDTRNHLIVLWAYSFVAIALEEAFPLYCISKESGLGLSELTIGKVLSATGLLFVMTQYLIHSYLVDKFGLVQTARIGAIFSGPLLVLVPISKYLNNSNGSAVADDTLTWQAFLFLSIVLGIYRVLSLCFFSSIAVLMNRTVIDSHRGTVNGLSNFGGSFFKGIGPIFAGYLVSFSTSSGIFPPELGGIVIYAVLGLLGAGCVVMTFVMLDKRPRVVDVHQE